MKIDDFLMEGPLGPPATLQIVGDTIGGIPIMFQASGTRAVPLAGPATDPVNS